MVIKTAACVLVPTFRFGGTAENRSSGCRFAFNVYAERTYMVMMMMMRAALVYFDKDLFSTCGLCFVPVTDSRNNYV